MKNEELVFLPLGGVGEIGMNFALYGYGPAREWRWMIVDVGVTFPGDDLPGADLVHLLCLILQKIYRLQIFDAFAPPDHKATRGRVHQDLQICPQVHGLKIWQQYFYRYHAHVPAIHDE